MTDSGIAFLDSLQSMAEAMPKGPYAYHPNGREDDDHVTLYSESHGQLADEVYQPHADYFATLDRESVLALVAVVRAAFTDDNAAMFLKGYLEDFRKFVKERPRG